MLQLNFNRGERVIKAMSPTEIYEIGKKFGVITKENESMVLSKINEFEGVGRVREESSSLSMKVLCYNIRGLGRRIKNKSLEN